MKKGLLILFILSSFNSKGTIHQIQVWSGYMQFLPPNNIIVQLGDTIHWTPLDPPTMSHTITSNNIPAGAVPFDQIWQMPTDTFFQYIPQVAGLYQYVCTPHIPMGMIGDFTVTNVGNTQTYVPDDNFEQALINLGYDTFLDDNVITANIDTVTDLDVSFNNINDLTGIEDFISLNRLNCNGNQITNIDVSANTSLSFLFCNNNYLTNLDLTQNTNLIQLEFYNNQLITLDVSNNTDLELLKCIGNQLTSLDVSNNTELLYLWCSYNQLTALDVSSNPDLEELKCDENWNLTSLDVRNGNNTNFSYFDVHNNPNLICIDVDNAAWSTANWIVANQNIDPQHYFSNNCSGTTEIQEYTTNKELLKVTDILRRETKQTNQPLFYIYDDGTVEKRINIE